MMLVYRVKISWNSVSSNCRVDRAHLWTSGMTWPKNWSISSNISGYTGLIFAIFFPHESTLCADDGSVAFFPIYQGILPWQPNNFAKMKANWYYVHSLHVRQIVARFRFDTKFRSVFVCKLSLNFGAFKSKSQNTPSYGLAQNWWEIIGYPQNTPTLSYQPMLTLHN